MIIVNQEKRGVFNFDNIIEIFVGYADNNEKASVRCGTINEKYEDLGIYKTTERAQEIIKEILEQYALNNLIFAPNFSAKNELGKYIPVFYMPEE